ncbi:MAG: DMT family transporter [Candidatus Marinimicrobia bacterium]|nr:DMT family transporter [Candidatus Neomarinimicrobiota bacterium]MBT3629868.1 DMT family transporter [Candidatus Neomarinimicrobiota bacterium]MBT3823635.1 DMT family transporter [Candidatus Neomarinimicrobiota bacterium]MBT4131008.1 DMT family transporter [Candidatus Neomarinimicrobiota bacterium]MBT4295968.1 DMT family transporter [Candidatus Neomarinimicrobiota bacterium]
MKRSEHTFLYIIMIIAMALWGLSWTNGKILGTYTSIPILMFWRFLIAGIFMGLVLWVRKTEWRITLAGLPSMVASAVFLVLYNHFYFTGTRVGPAGGGGVLVTTLNPLLTFLLISIVRRKLPRGRSLAGLLLGIFGGTILINFWQEGWSAILSSGNQYFVLCAGTWAFLTFISSRINRHMSTLTYSFWLYLLSSVLALFFVDTSQLLSVFDLDMIFWLNLLSVSVGAMAFATTAFFIAASRLGSEKASAFIFTVPLSALIFSMLILNEPLKWNIVFGGSLSIIAVFLINSAKKSS